MVGPSDHTTATAHATVSTSGGDVSTVRSGGRTTGWVGWTAFAAAMMLLIGFLNIMNGLAAIATDDIFVDGQGGSIVLDVTAWGWFHLITGVLLVAVGLGLLAGKTWAVIAAILLVMLNVITQMLLLPSYPFWSIVIITLDVFVLWALTVHGDERLNAL